MAFQSVPYTGRQYCAVDSNTASVTCSCCSHAAKCSISSRVVPNFRLTYSVLPSCSRRTITASIFLCTSMPAKHRYIGFITSPGDRAAEDRSRFKSPSQALPVRSPGLPFFFPAHGPRSNTRTASPYPVRATTSTAATIYSIFIRTFARERAKITLMRAASRLVSTPIFFSEILVL